MNEWIIFLLTFMAMELIAWSLHKYVMHGFLWYLHKDHHCPRANQIWQKNDFFALFFAIPSFLLILYHSYSSIAWVGAIGYGIMAYGLAYFLVHEVIIHRRIKIKIKKSSYINGLIQAHRHHHQVRTKQGASNFGMLWVNPIYFKGTSKKRL